MKMTVARKFLRLATHWIDVKNFSTDALNAKIESLKKDSTSFTNHLSTLFINIDGCLTNFDHLLVILKSINHTFSAIGIAETNIGPNSAKPYVIPGYNSFYQEITEDKSKGTGVCLYVSNSLSATINETFSTRYLPNYQLHS